MVFRTQRMSTKEKLLPLLIISLLSLASCKFIPPKITNARGFRMEQRSDGHKALVMELEIENKNFIGFRLKNPLATLRLNGQEIGRADAPLNLKIKARSKNYQTIELRSDISWKQALGTIGYTVTSGKVKLELDGSMTARTAFVKKPLLFRVDKEYSIMDLLKQ